MAVEAGLSVYVVGGQGVRLFVVVVNYHSNIIVSGGIAKNGLSKCKVDPCWVCSLRVTVIFVLCLQCGKWVHCRCAGMKRVTPKFKKNVTCRKCEGNTGEAVELEVKLCDEADTISEFTYLGDMVSVGGGCKAAVAARTRCRWVKFRECGELLYGRRFPLRL